MWHPRSWYLRMSTVPPRLPLAHHISRRAPLVTVAIRYDVLPHASKAKAASTEVQIISTLFTAPPRHVLCASSITLSLDLGSRLGGMNLLLLQSPRRLSSEPLDTARW
ncbi:hypothetical protein Vafri_869 [Volvox africanus]|nr:hypothetical protein Vafri_869 [Volvox africanus]